MSGSLFGSLRQILLQGQDDDSYNAGVIAAALDLLAQAKGDQMLVKRGQHVRSKDERDDANEIFVVLETNIITSSGPSARIAPTNDPGAWIYRPELDLIVTADGDA